MSWQIADDDVETARVREVTALYQDAASRLLAGAGYATLASRQARKLCQTLDDNGGRTASGDAAAVRKSSAQQNLQSSLPEWYEMHNRRCQGCCVPLLLGLNASYSSHLRGLLCRECATLNVLRPPSSESKRLLRSQRVRCTGQLNGKESDVAPNAAATTKRKQLDVPQRLHDEDEQTSQMTLDERKANLKRQAKAAKLAARPTIQDALANNVNDDARFGAKRVERAVTATSTTIAPQNDVSTRFSLPPRKITATPSAKQSSSKQDMTALRAALQSAKKKKGESDKRQGGGSGLQSFLSGL